MKMLRFILLAIITTSLFISCDKTDDLVLNPVMDDVLYFNSFETDADKDGLFGNGYSISMEVAESAGDSSLLVSGGCVGAHFGIDLGPYDTDKLLSINFIAKSSHESCGFLTLRNMNSFENIYVEIQDTIWQEYVSADTLLLEAQDTLRLDVVSGGIFECPAWLDLLTIKEIN